MAGLIADATDEELTRYAAAIKAEQDRRRTLARAEGQVHELNAAYLSASGIERGQPWRQPTGAHDAYPEGWAVEWEGSQWVSLIGGNVWQPGVSGWREEVEEGAAPPEWVQPTGAHDAYNTGDSVTFEGTVWVSVIDGNVWSPTAHPAGWKRGEGSAAEQES